MEMNWGEKRTTQRIHLIDVNGGLNNKQITLRKVVNKEKQELWAIKGTNERYELKQLPTYNTQFLEYNLMGNNVKDIFYLQQHPIRVNI
jgi:hypothetical protein